MKRLSTIAVAATALFAAAANLLALTTGELSSAHSLKISTHAGYLPGLPVLVRIEVRNDLGRSERELWDADATLSADNGVTLSTNRVRLRNGLGSALVAFRDGGNFVLTASVGPLQTTRQLVTLTNSPVTTVGGALTVSNTVWSGVVRVTNDVTVPVGSTLTIQSNTLVRIDGVTSSPTTNDLLISG